MNKMIRNVVITAFICLLLAGAAWFLLKPEAPWEKADTQTVLTDRELQDISRIDVENKSGTYTVEQRPDGTYRVHDLPDDVVNMDYVIMLLEESSQITYEQMVEEHAADIGKYGLETPAASVDITYRDGSSFLLLLGAEEPVSKARYAMAEGSNQVVLLKDSRCIRFLMPVDRYIQYIIIEPNESADILRSIGDVTFAGSLLEEPVVLKEVTEKSEETLIRQAASFGAITHMITWPVLHEADSSQLTEVADSLMGLISEGVVAYNCTEETLARYGFDDPLLTVEFDYKNHTGKDAQHMLLAMSRMEDGTAIVTLNDQGIIYKIADVAFTEVTYDSLVLRWFLSPLLTDVKAVEITADGQSRRLDTHGVKPQELVVHMGEQEIDPALYRKFYTLVVSAAADGAMLEHSPQLSGEPVLEIHFIYKDEQKPPDVMRFYEGPVRRMYVEVNGICEYTIRENYVNRVKEAFDALSKDKEFYQDW